MTSYLAVINKLEIWNYSPWNWEGGLLSKYDLIFLLEVNFAANSVVHGVKSMMSGKATLHNSRPVYNQMSAKPICKREDNYYNNVVLLRSIREKHSR